MKIDIGQGKILGTKRVSPNGQVSGFTEYAGKEVLVVLPEGEAEVRPDAREMVEEVRAATVQQMRVAFREYRGLKSRFQGPNEAAKHFLDAKAPRSFKGLYEKIETWVQEQASTAEAHVERTLDRIEDEPDEPGADTSVDVDPPQEAFRSPTIDETTPPRGS